MTSVPKIKVFSAKMNGEIQDLLPQKALIFAKKINAFFQPLSHFNPITFIFKKLRDHNLNHDQRQGYEKL